MREIKFRAWDEKLKCMHATDSVSLCIDGEICYLDTDGEWVADMANRITLMQYTGLKDKNGTEIYEGDIIRHNGRMQSVMEFVEEDAGFKIMNKNHCMMHPSKEFFMQHVEVIGNIYEQEGK